MYDHNTQRPRGFGFITYDSEEAVDRVLVRTFHELNSKMVEVKRAVPKELSPSPSRSPGIGYNYGINGVNSLFNGYTHGYNLTIGGCYGVRMDGRFSPIASGRNGFPQYDSGSRIGINFEPDLYYTYRPCANFGNSLSYGRALNPYDMNSANRFGSPINYDGRNGGSSSPFSSSRNLWGNGGLNDDTICSIPTAFLGAETGNINGSFGSSNVDWISSQVPRQGGSNAAGSGGNLQYTEADSSYNSGGGNYGRTGGSNIAPTSSTFVSSHGGFDGALSDLYGGISIYGDRTWRAETPERDDSDSFSYGLGNSGFDVSAKGSAGGYSVDRRLSNGELPS